MRKLAVRRRLLRFMGAAGAGLVVPGLTFPRLTFSQAAKKIPTVAVLFAGDSDDDEPVVRPFFERMTALGWSEGKTVAFDRHSGKGTRQYLTTMATLATGREPDLIYATTTTLASAVLKESAGVPVVFSSTTDPVKIGLVDSLAKPGRNATGTYQVSVDASPKRFKLARQALPAVKRMGAIFDRNAPEFQARRVAHEKAARAHGFELVSAEFTNFEAIAKILAQFKRDNLVAVEITPSFALIGRRREVASLAALNGVALIGHRVEWAEAGAVLTYGADISESHRRAAGIADRILKGTKPAVIPVERVQKFEFAINNRVANDLALHIPKAVLQRADRVFG